MTTTSAAGNDAARLSERVAGPGDRARAAWLANSRQELLAPVAAILELSQMMLNDARDLGNPTFLADQEQLYASARNLLEMVNALLDPEKFAADADFAKRLRHDLRTPLAHVIGLCEIWLEDAEDQLLEGFVNDLREVHSLSNRLLVSIEDILRFGQLASDPEILLPSLDPSGMIHDVVDSLAPPAANGPAGAPAEAGAILVVDDNAINRDLLLRRLSREGHRVTTACNGREALEAVRATPFDLVLLDIIMPELNGFQVLEQLKADEGLRHIPVIMISAFHEIESAVRCIERGAEDYLSKPFEPVLLKARINACLEKKRLRDREVLYLEQIQREKQRSDELLHVILPAEVARELKADNAVKPRRYENVAVLFCDIVGFTPYCDRNRPERVVAHLQQLIEAWEDIALRHQVEKIKTIGDAFMAASGLLRPADNPVLNCVRCGLEMIEACQRLPTRWNVRVGVHVGPVVAGVIGRRQYLFDLWGDTVNLAARMESHGTPGAVNLSSEAWQRVAHCCRGEARGLVPVKGKGSVAMIRFDHFLG